jgi:hypothetical protein
MDHLKTVLVTQSFGRENEYRRVLFTILSYVSFTSTDCKIVLFTDNPDWFSKPLLGLSVDYVALTPEKVKQMRGEIDFLHRMKIALIEESFQKYPDCKILYADSDTFFTKNPESLIAILSPSRCCMHLYEYQFDEIKDAKLPAGQSFRDFYRLINNSSFKLANNQPINVSPTMVSWNAGVMFFHPEHKKFIPDVYALTDQFYPESKNHASEQYAFSIILQTNIEIVACESVNYHYWYRIKKQIADQFFLSNMTDDFFDLPLSLKLSRVQDWVIKLPVIFDTHEWTIRDKAIQAFNTNDFLQGYKWGIQAIVQKPFGSKSFLKDVLYHLKRQIKGRE